MARIGRKWLWAVFAVVPLILFVLLRKGVVNDPSWSVPQFHFFIVSLTSLVALFMAGLLVIAAGQLKDARVVFLSLAFLGIAGIFAVHGLTTPNALFTGMNPWVSFSAGLSLLVGSIFFALSTLDRNRAAQRFVVRHQVSITVSFLVALSLYAAVAFIDTGRGGVATQTNPSLAGVSEPAHDYGETAADEYGASSAYGNSNSQPAGDEDERFGFLKSESLELATSLLSLFLFGVVTVHYGRLYLRFPTPLLLGIALSSAFLLQAQLSMSIAANWQASWWEYHVLMLAGFIVVLVGLAMEYKQSGTLDGVVAGLLVRNTIDQLQRGYTDVIVALVNAVEAKDIYTRGHTQRVTELAVQIGEELRLAPDRLRILSQAAMLHDIGKIGVPDQILNKRGPLTDDEFNVIKEHPVRGHAIIREVRSLQPALGGIRHHHERMNGTGYPDGLAGEAIPLDARIIAVADVFDALTSARSYRDAWPVSRAVAALHKDAGIGLDAGCVDALDRVLARQEYASAAPAIEPQHAGEASHALAAQAMAD
jgi:hypothetical protein